MLQCKMVIPIIFENDPNPILLIGFGSLRKPRILTDSDSNSDGPHCLKVI